MKKNFSALLLAFMVSTSVLSAPTHATGGDLSLGDASVWFSTDSYLEGHTIRIWASVANGSTEDLLGSVRISANSKQVGVDQAVSALAGKTDEVFVDWVPTSYGTYSITVTVTPWESAGDNPSNNTVTKSVTVVQDSDRDGNPNSTDVDDDNDNVNDEEDEFPTNKEESKDSDGDGQGNNADQDDDNDGTGDAADQLPEDPNYTKDMDGDGFADEIDKDVDGDGLENKDETRASTTITNPDSDGDFYLDGTDLYPLDASEWADTDEDGVGDNSDPDIDNDQLLNEVDSDPSNPAPVANADEDILLASIDEEITFDAGESEDDREIVKYVWNFGDESFEGRTVTYAYDSAGTKVATLTVYDAEGQSDTIDVKVHVFGKGFLIKAISFSLFLLLLAFYLIYRYNRRALGKKTKKNDKK